MNYLNCCQICNAGKTSWEIIEGRVCINPCASLQNLLNWRRLNASESSLSSDLTCLTETFQLLTKLLRIRSHIKYMEFLQDEVCKFTILTTASLLQNIIIYMFLSRSPQVNKAAVKANSSKYSMLGLYFLM